MRRFILTVLSVTFLSLFGLALLTYIEACNLRKINYKISDNAHIVIVGSSQTSRAINDSFCPHIANLSKDGVTMSSYVGFLKKVIENNPHIDTILISHGSFEYAPRPFYEGWKREQYLMPYTLLDLTETNWRYKVDNYNFLKALFNPKIESVIHTIRTKKTFTDYEIGFTRNDDGNFLYGDGICGISYFDKARDDHGGVDYTKAELLNNFADRNKSSLRAIEICKEHNIVPVLFFSPIYQADRWYSKKGFCEILQDYDKDLLIADYEDFQFPDETYYRDVQHVNSKGAEYISKHITSKGIHTLSVKEYLKEHARP